MDRDDGAEAGEMDVPALEGVGHPLSCGHDWCGVRLLCWHSTTGTEVVAGAWVGMVVPVVHRAEADVEAICDRKSAFPLESGKGKGLEDLTMVFFFEDIPPKADVIYQHSEHRMQI